MFKSLNLHQAIGDKEQPLTLVCAHHQSDHKLRVLACYREHISLGKHSYAAICTSRGKSKRFSVKHACWVWVLSRRHLKSPFQIIRGLLRPLAVLTTHPKGTFLYQEAKSFHDPHLTRSQSAKRKNPKKTMQHSIVCLFLHYSANGHIVQTATLVFGPLQQM